MSAYDPNKTQEIYRCRRFRGNGAEVSHETVKKNGMTSQIERIIEIWDEDNNLGWSFWNTHEMTIHPDGNCWVLTIHFVGDSK